MTARDRSFLPVAARTWHGCEHSQRMASNNSRGGRSGYLVLWIQITDPVDPTSDFRTGWWQADWGGGDVRPVRYLGRARRLPFRRGPRHVAAISGQQDDATWPAEHCLASQWQCPILYRWSGLPPRHPEI